MQTIRRADDRGHSTLSWLDSRHSFSFAEYYDPAHMGVSNLRVINDDVIDPQGGFGTHPHRDMEIITYVMEGQLEHKDSMGNGSIIGPGDIQRMSAGTGVQHSEFNHSDQLPVRLLQIWLQPNAMGVEPGYEQINFPLEKRVGGLQLLVSPDGRDGSISTRQDGLLYGAFLTEDQQISHGLAAGRTAYLHVAKGIMEVNGQRLSGGDALIIEQEPQIVMKGIDQAELLLFDLP